VPFARGLALGNGAAARLGQAKGFAAKLFLDGDGPDESPDDAGCDYLSYWCRALRRHQGTTELGWGVTGPLAV
jgi:hypothetical protein